MAVSPTSRSVRLLDRRLPLDGEQLLFVLVVIASVIAHLWGLGTMALHHDESIHAWSSWRFYSGNGGFNCWAGLDEAGNARTGVITHETYCYDPVYHGPSLYFLTALGYFLFGDGDAQARLPMAIAGILMTASTWWLRPYLGRWGTLAAALLLTFSPSLLYYTRFARHDGLMVLWELWLLIGALRWLDSGKPRWLYLTAAALGLAIGTHELYYILLFIFGIFVLIRLLSESRFAARLNLGLLITLAVLAVLIVINPPLPIGRGLYVGEKAFLIASALMMAWLSQRLWDERPLLTTRLQQLWTQQRPVLWTTLSLLGAIYIVQYTTFFTYLPGAIDGLVGGLVYWLGSQQDYARGDQPWYYYLMQLPLYEPLAVLSAIGMILAMSRAALLPLLQRGGLQLLIGVSPRSAASPTIEADGVGETLPAARPARQPWPLFALLTAFWLVSATIIFSWAGEKMPWLVVHMALPGNLLTAWLLAQLVRRLQLRRLTAQERRQLLLSAPAAILLLVGVGTAIWRAVLGSGSSQAAQAMLLQALIPALLAGAMGWYLWQRGRELGRGRVLATVGLTLALLIGGYTVRATWLVVYHHPDTPIEPLIYTQTAPDVPRYVAQVRELAINLTRNSRTAADPTGGLSMPIALDGGGSSGDGSLAWPLQWYLRDFQRVNWIDGGELGRTVDMNLLQQEQPDGQRDFVPVVMLYQPHISTRLRTELEQQYVQANAGAAVFNWWFPEGDKCSPQSAGYKKFYYSSWTAAAELGAVADVAGECGRDISADVHGPFAALLWPFLPENWPALGRYLLFRDLPGDLQPGSRDMEVWIRRDLVGGGDAAGSTAGSSIVPIAAAQEILINGANGPTGIAIAGDGRIAVADTANHRIVIYDAAGVELRSIGGLGSEPGRFYEPRGLAFDSSGNLYVADTWNARIVKFDRELTAVASWGSGDQELGDGRTATITGGDAALNEANPLGFFGPRGVAVDAAGRVYIADTGNKRIVVTDSDGAYLYQFGGAGRAAGEFNEPTSPAIGRDGRLYVADTWNGRVQIFEQNDSGVMQPVQSFNVLGWLADTYDDPSLTLLPDGHVAVSVPTRGTAAVYSSAGTLLLQWGGPGDGRAALNGPSGLAADDSGRVWIVNRNNGSVRAFAIPTLQGTP
jgi:uncharacterized protein (TIGR03663 family)